MARRALASVALPGNRHHMRPGEPRARREAEDLILKSFVQLFPTEPRGGLFVVLPFWQQSRFLGKKLDISPRAPHILSERFHPCVNSLSRS